MSESGDTFRRAMPDVAAELCGEPNKGLSSNRERRYGSNGSLSIDLDKGTWYSYEEGAGGGVIELVERQLACSRSSALAWLEERGHIDPLEARDVIEGRANGSTAHDAEPADTYVYNGPDGTARFRVRRFRKNDGSKTFRQDRWERGVFVPGVKGVELVPYRLDEVLAEITAPVAIVEGEKDVNALWDRGFVATCNPAGAGKWLAVFGQYLAGRDVIVVPDNDPPGRKHAESICRSLAGIASRIRILELPDLPDKGDVSDWLTNHTSDELQAEFDRAPVADERALALLADGKPAARTPLPCVDVASLFGEPNPRRFVLQDWIPIGSVTSLYGRGGSGKSFISQLLATSIATDNHFVGIDVHPGPVLAVFAEDDRDELHRRQITFNRYLNISAPEQLAGLHLIALDAVSNFLFEALDGGEPKWTDFADRLEATLDLIRPKLLILDNVAQLYGANENDRALVTAFLNGLRTLARRFDCAVLLLGHPARGKVAGDSYSGSTAWEAGVRSRIEFEKKEKVDEEDEHEPDRYSLTLCKANYAKVRTIDLIVDASTGVVRRDSPDNEAPSERLDRQARERDHEQRVLKAVEALWQRGLVASKSPKARDNYLPNLIAQYGFAGGMTQRQAANAMERLIAKGDLTVARLGTYPSRTARYGLATQAMRETA